MSENKDLHVRIDRSLYDQVMAGVFPGDARGHLARTVHIALEEYFARKNDGRRGSPDEIDREVHVQLFLIVGVDLLVGKLQFEGRTLYDYLDEVRAKTPAMVEEWVRCATFGAIRPFDLASLEEYQTSLHL